MLDATPAADVSARPQLPPGPAAIAGAPQTRSGAGALVAAARTLLPVLEAGRPLDAATLRDAMTRAFGASDAQGAWVWKDAYEASEAAAVLFLQRYARAMRNRAGAGADGPRKMLSMLAAIAALEPSHTKRSERQIRLQQFSTPLPLAYAALKAAAIRPGDTVLEPSAGTGMLAVMAQCALASRVAGHLHLNEIADVRAGLLAALFPEADVTRHNAEAIADFLPELRPSVVLMNPPFSATPGVERIRHDADLRHLRSAFSMLPPGGRLAAITSSHCVPGDAPWRDAFSFLDGTVRVVFTMAIDGRAYARRGTGFDTRLTVLDRSAGPGIAVDRDTRAPDAAALLDAVIAHIPPRMAIEPVPGADLFGHRPAPRATTPKTARKPAAHLRHFVRVRHALLKTGALGASLVELLDNVRAGVVQLDRRGRLIAVNDRALALLRRGDGLRDEGGRLRAALPGEDAALQGLIARALPLTGGPGEGGSMPLGRPEARSRLVLHVSPVRDAGIEYGRGRVGALVLAVDPADRAGFDPERVGKALGLTPAESRVAVALAEGRTVDEIAAQSGRSRNTVKWHIQHIYAALGVSRRIELARRSRRWPTSRGGGAEPVRGGASGAGAGVRMSPPEFFLQNPS